jgi:hypothetical protein
MRNFLIVLLATLATYVAGAQTVDFTYQGWSTQSGNNNISLYVARDGFKLGSAFNDQNYPIWYVENRQIDIASGVINYRITGVSVDSLSRYAGQLYLYVSINGTPHDTIPMDPTPYAAHSISSVRSMYSDSAAYARNAGDASSASYAVFAYKSRLSDTADVAKRAILADSSILSARSAVSYYSDSSDRSRVADSALVSNSTHRVLDGGVTLVSIAASGSTTDAVLTTNGTDLLWKSPTVISGKIQLTLIPITSISDDVRTLIFRVAQDFNSPLPAAAEGRIITIVNSSTANFITIQSGIWNIWGGDVVIGPRSSATLLYTSGQWVVVSQ